MPTPDNATLATAATARLRVLVADDAPGSCRFLCDGLQQLGVGVTAALHGATAMQEAREQVFDLLLLDCHMPGAGALQILSTLRADGTAASCASMAVATTAELVPRDRRQLLENGFSDILLKPCTMADLRRLLGLVVPGRSDGPMLDDDAALSTSGNLATMRALRLLLREELAVLSLELDALLDDPAHLEDRLHRLRSSCGFCGATALASQCVALQRQLVGLHIPPTSVARFRATLLATLQALDD